jgi:hypothetical protein
MGNLTEEERCSCGVNPVTLRRRAFEKDMQYYWSDVGEPGTQKFTIYDPTIYDDYSYTTIPFIEGGKIPSHDFSEAVHEDDLPKIRLYHDDYKFNDFSHAKKKIIRERNPALRERFTPSIENEINESFNSPLMPDMDRKYLNILQSYAIHLITFLNAEDDYSKWKSNWKLLDSNMKKNKLTFKQLQESDADVAYVIDKGESVNFKVRDNKRYAPVKFYQYVLYHEMAHMATEEIGHTTTFHKLLNLICLAAYENRLITLESLGNDYVEVGGMKICSRNVYSDEIIDGCKFMENKSFYEAVIRRVNSQK